QSSRFAPCSPGTLHRRGGACQLRLWADFSNVSYHTWLAPDSPAPRIGCRHVAGGPWGKASSAPESPGFPWRTGGVDRSLRIRSRFPCVVCAQRLSIFQTMSLVEQAALRLEQLRKAGKQVAGDLAYPELGAPKEPKLNKASTIERLANELE